MNDLFSLVSGLLTVFFALVISIFILLMILNFVAAAFSFCRFVLMEAYKLFRFFRTSFLVLFFLLFCASPVFALDMEFYTYGGFDAIAVSFQKMSLIFSDSTYKSLFFVVIVCSIAAGAGTNIYRAFLSSGKGTTLGWVAPVVVGILIYFGLISKTGNLWIYDPIKNQSQTVSGVPDGVVLIAGVMNKIERGLVDIVSNAGDPVGFQQQAGGVSFNMLYGMGTNGILLADKNIQISLNKYIEDCVFFELNRPGTTLTIDSLSNNSDFVALLEQAVNPAIFTEYFPGNISESCLNVWNGGGSITDGGLKAKITDVTTFDSSLKNMCAQSGYDSTNVLEFTQCKNAVSNLGTWIEGSVIDETQVARQVLMSNAISDAITFASPDVAMSMLASRSTGNTMISAGMMTNEWLPVMRAVATAIVISLIPLIALFIPTPLYGKAVSAVFGFFMWLTFWGVIDAIVHQFAMDMSYRYFEIVRQNQLGMVAIMSFQGSAMKSLAVFGYARSMSIMLSTVLTGMFVHFGGAVMGQFVGQLTGPVSSGAERGAQVTTPEESAKILKEEQTAAAMWKYGDTFNFKDRVTADVNRMAHEVGSGLGMGNVEDAFKKGSVESQMGVAVSQRTQELATMSGGFKNFADMNTAQQESIAKRWGSPQNYQKFVDATYGMDVGGRTGLIEVAGKLGMSPEEFTKKGSYMDNLQKGGAINAFADAVKNGKLSDESLMKIGETGILKSAGGAEILDMMAQKAGGYNKLAEWDYAHLGANIDAFGRAENYKDFLKNNADISQGQQQAMIDAAKESGVNLKDWAQTNAYMSELRKSDVFDKFKKGEISHDDFKMMGLAGVLTEKGMTEAKQSIANRFFGGKIDKAEKYFRTMEGRQNYARFHELEKYAKSRDVNTDRVFESMMRTGTFSADAEMANKLGLKGPGQYSVAWDEIGKPIFARGTEGVTDGYITGPDLSPDTMWNAAVSKDSTLADRIMRTPTVSSRNEEETTQAVKFAESLGQRVSKTGAVADVTSRDGGLHLSLGPIRIGAGHSTKEVEDLNFKLYYGEIQKIQSEARASATSVDGKFDESKYRGKLTQDYFDLASKTNELAGGKFKDNVKKISEEKDNAFQKDYEQGVTGALPGMSKKGVL